MRFVVFLEAVLETIRYLQQARKFKESKHVAKQ